MKLLGKFGTEQANNYIDLLNKNGIECSAEDIFEDKVPNEIHFEATQSAIHSYVKIFVPEKDYQNSVEIIKKFELQLEQTVKKDGKVVNRLMLKILIGFLCIVGLIIYIGSRGW